MTETRDIIIKYEDQLNALFRLVRATETFLGPEDDWVEDDRRILFEAAQRHLGHVHTFVYDIGTTDYVTTAHVTPDAFERVLHDAGYERNLVSARKRRDTDGGKQYVHGSWAKYDGEGHQHHVFIFESPNGGTDIYAHYEDNVTDSAAHLHVHDDENDIDGMVRAAPRGLYGLMDNHDIHYGTRESLKQV